MNFLAHLHLVHGDRDLMLGALLGDFVRGRRDLWSWPAGVRDGIRMHRRIDKLTDHSQPFKNLQREFPKPFRRYSGIIIDLAFDHVLACRWQEYSDVTLPEFDRDVRHMLAEVELPLPDQLVSFMAYADRRGLFQNYRDENEMLFSLAGIGRRLKRGNPLHQVSDIWPQIRPQAESAFAVFYPEIQSRVALWRSRRSTTTGS